MKNLIFILFFISMQCAVAQDIELSWDAGEKLKWSDFKATPDRSHPYAAITYSGMSYGFSADVVNGEVYVNYKVNCFFVANKSWVKRRYLGDAELLKHEQLHFDITELFTRKFRKELSTMNFTENVKSEIKTAYKRLTSEKVLLQEQYDSETDHSKNEQAQKTWQLKIDSELQKLLKFASK